MSQVRVKLGCVGLALIASIGLSACSKNAQTDLPVITQLNELSAELDDVCRSRLLTVGNDLFGSKQHFLSKSPLSVSQDHRYFGTLIYKDRPAFIEFTVINAAKDKAKHTHCDVSYTLSYQLDVPCLTAREEAFKKWLVQGKLGENTHIYVHKRNKNKMAYLTNISRGLQCLVHVKVLSPDQQETSQP